MHLCKYSVAMPVAMLTPAEVEAQAKEAGLTIVEACQKAGIAVSTFYRWRSGATSPRLDVYQRLYHAVCSAAEAVAWSASERRP